MLSYDLSLVYHNIVTTALPAACDDIFFTAVDEDFDPTVMHGAEGMGPVCGADLLWDLISATFGENLLSESGCIEQLRSRDRTRICVMVHLFRIALFIGMADDLDNDIGVLFEDGNDHIQIVLCTIVDRCLGGGEKFVCIEDDFEIFVSQKKCDIFLVFGRCVARIEQCGVGLCRDLIGNLLQQWVFDLFFWGTQQCDSIEIGHRFGSASCQDEQEQKECGQRGKFHRRYYSGSLPMLCWKRVEFR